MFHFYTIFALIISLAKYQTLSNHDVLARNKERISFSLFLLVLIISINTHLFIHLTTQKKKTEIIQNINRYIVKKYKEKKIVLHSKRIEYLATGTRGQNISTFFPTLRFFFIAYRILELLFTA